MATLHRDIQNLVMDYAGALRDGCIPDFLKSLTREEATTLQASRELPEAAEMVRLLNGISFGDKIVMPNISLFISRVDARIGSRLKRSNTASSKPAQRARDKQKTNIQ
jgi:hypothetical protein